MNKKCVEDMEMELIDSSGNAEAPQEAGENLPLTPVSLPKGKLMFGNAKVTAPVDCDDLPALYPLCTMITARVDDGYGDTHREATRVFIYADGRILYANGKAVSKAELERPMNKAILDQARNDNLTRGVQMEKKDISWSGKLIAVLSVSLIIMICLATWVADIVYNSY